MKLIDSPSQIKNLHIWPYRISSLQGCGLIMSVLCADAVALAGVDYLVVGPRVIASLANAATMQGYNDGWRSGASGEEGGIVPALSPEAAKYVDFHPDETLQITKQLFQDGLGSAGLELLDSGIDTLSAGVQQLEEAFRSRAFDRL